MAQRTKIATTRVETSPPRPAAASEESRRRRTLRNLGYRLFQPVDGASLAVFRMLFGAIMVWEVFRYFSYQWIARYFIEPPFHFTFLGFGWVEPWPGNWMKVHFVVLGVLAACIALGLFYRIAAPLFFLAFTYVFLLEQARYLNHFYLICLLALLLAIVPAHRTWSLDSLLRTPRPPETVPTWSLWLLRAQIGIVFFFAGVAKLNGDWFRGEPLRTWMASETDFPVIGRFFTEPLSPYLFSYGGLAFDLFVIPFLIWPRTRPFAFLAAISFHTVNSQLFTIGIFPWLALGTALLFFPPDWPRFRWLRARKRPPRQPLVTSAPPAPRGWRPSRVQTALVAALGAYLLIQVLVPLRHFAIPGHVSWTEEGHHFAWHMKLRDKASDSQFRVVDSEGAEGVISPTQFLTPWQASKMSSRPDMIVQFAHYLESQAKEAGLRDVKVYVDVMASLNGREEQRLIDPKVDLTKVDRPPLWGGSDWIVPLND